MSLQPQSNAESGLSTAEVDRLLLELERNLDSARISLKQQEALLGRIKVLGRDPKHATSIFASRGIATLSKYGLDSGSSTTSQEALKCLANAFLLNEPSRQIFVDLDYAPKAADRLKNDNSDDEFLISRILFLMTYNTQLDFQALVDKHHLAQSIIQHISWHAKAFVKGNITVPPMQDAAMSETLKLLFNITYYYPGLIDTFIPAIEPLISLVMHHPLATPPLQPPMTYVLNALMNMNLQGAEKKTPIGRESRKSPLFPYANPESVVDRLISIFDLAIKNHPERELDEAAASLCTLIRKAYEMANSQMQSWMRWILLPREKDRDKPLGQGEMLSSRLLRLSCSPTLPTLRENISSLLFELSDKDAETFVRNIGYGFASGFLMSHNIAVPANAAEAHSLRSDDDTSSGAADINPVTGQKYSAENGHDGSGMDDMTEEEKEREAERLFVLFERLRATGVVDVKNPVQQALDEGRFEELPD